MNFNHDHSFLELVSDGDQINLSSNAVPHFESRNSEPRSANSLKNPNLRGKFHMSVFPTKKVTSKLSYRMRLGGGDTSSIIFDETDEGVQMLKSRNIKRFSQQKLTEVENRLRVLNHHDKTVTKRNILQEKLVEKYFSVRKAAKREQEEAEEAIRALKTNESLERKEKVLKLKYAWA